MQGVRLVLYRLIEVIRAALVLIVEGEKDVEKVREMGFTATTNVGGAGKWRREYNGFFSGRDVVVLIDKDEPGRKHAEHVAKSLKGVAKSIRILELPGLAEKGDVSDWIETGGTKKELERLIGECPEWEEDVDEEGTAKKLYPRGPFPWGVLPPRIADSLKQLARSCATSATSLPGAAIAIFASLIGSIVSVCPKKVWYEALIFWFCDIRPSGEGKTHAARELCEVVYDAQTRADKDYKARMEQYLATPKRDRGEPPGRPRGYFVTDLTLEGLREDHSGHGGMVCIMDEVSAFLSAQNQYRGGKGSDREAWLSLYDGKPARVVRVNKTVFIRGARISLFGGTQPPIWKACFRGSEGVFLEDGTVFRFSPVYEGSAFHPLTAESWSDENRGAWENLLKAAMAWADSMQERGEKKGLVLSQSAQEIFFDWRNELMRIGGDLPSNVRGFIPKLVGSAARFAGVFYLMDVFSKGEEPGAILNPVDIKKGISVSEFYLGHIIAAMELLTDDDASQPFEVTEQAIHLAKTLDGMRSEVDSGRLAVGYVWERFNTTCRKEQKIKSERAMGAVLRRCGLNIANGKQDANQRRRVRCLQWDQKAEGFMQDCLQSHQRLQNQENQMVIGGDIDRAMSATSPEKEGNLGSEETWETMQEGRLRAEQAELIDNGDVGDFGDVMPAGNQNRELDWSF